MDFASESQRRGQIENSNVVLQSVHDELLGDDPLGVGDDEGDRVGAGAVDATDRHVRDVSAVGK